MKSKRLKLMAEYGAIALWGVDEADIGPVEPSELPLTDDLRAALERWAEAYDRTLNHDDPRESGFAGPSEEDAFEAEGRRLWDELRSQLGPDWSVSYFSDRDHTLYE